MGLGPVSCTHGAEGRTGTCAWGGGILDYRCSWGARGEWWLCPGAGLLAGLEQLQRLLGVWLVPLVVPVLHRVAETGEGTIAVSTLMTFLELAGERGLGSTDSIAWHPGPLHARALCHVFLAPVLLRMTFSFTGAMGKTLNLQNKPHQGGAGLCWVPAVGSCALGLPGQIQAHFIDHS